MRLIPVNGHVLVEIPADDSGLVLPESLSDSTQEGIVIDEDIEAIEFPEGTRVRWERYAEADGEFDYAIPDGVNTRTVKAVLIPKNKITAFWKS